MTVISMTFLVLIIIILALVLDHLQGINLKKYSYLSKKSRIEENALKEAKRKKMRSFHCGP
jgi:predicted Holliday junction resolvase-like endonuclease